MQVKEVTYESNGFTFIDHQNGKVSIPGKGGRYLNFDHSILETVKQFHDALSDFLEVKEEDCDGNCENCFINYSDDDDDTIDVKFQVDEKGWIPFEVAMIAMRQGLKVREQNRDTSKYCAIKDGEFVKEKFAVIKISSKEMLTGKREIVPPIVENVETK